MICNSCNLRTYILADTKTLAFLVRITPGTQRRQGQKRYPIQGCMETLKNNPLSGGTYLSSPNLEESLGG